MKSHWGRLTLQENASESALVAFQIHFYLLKVCRMQRTAVVEDRCSEDGDVDGSSGSDSVGAKSE